MISNVAKTHTWIGALEKAFTTGEFKRFCTLKESVSWQALHMNVPLCVAWKALEHLCRNKTCERTPSSRSDLKPFTISPHIYPLHAKAEMREQAILLPLFMDDTR